ncbi:hypothetical protein V6N13_092977 [Hibiscus sabdariffa]
MDKNPTTNSLKSQNPSKPLSNDDRCVKKPHQSGINPPDDDAVAMDLSSSALHNKEPYTNYPNMVIPPHALSDFNVVASNMVGQNSCMQTGTEVIETMEGIENTITAPPSIGQRPFSYKVALLGPNIDQIVEYEALPTICFRCGKYCHVNDICPSLAPEQPSTPTVNLETTPNLNDPKNSNFGPWMKVECRLRRTASKQFQPVDKPIVQGSRFNLIFEMPDEDVHISKIDPDDTPAAPGRTEKTQPRHSVKIPKQRTSIPIRKPLTVSLQASTSKAPSKLRKAKETTRNTVGFNREILLNHFQFLHFKITKLSDSSFTLATLVYASPSVTKRNSLWDHLTSLACSITTPWVLLGDFNATLSSSDYKGCSARPSRLFQKFVFNHGLHDLGYRGPDFTWNRGAVYARLD